MSQSMYDQKIYQLIALREEINKLGVRLNKNEPIFRDLQTPPLLYTCSEAGFLKVVSWLYTLYYESGKVNIDFLIGKISCYLLDQEQSGSKHKNIIHSLRTTLQHSLDTNNRDDLGTQQNCSHWFQEKCDESLPATTEKWRFCLENILLEGIMFLTNIRECLLLIEKDEFCGKIIEEWNIRCSRFHPFIEYERIVSEVSSDIGMEKIDAKKICKIYYEQWSKELEILRSDYIFEVEARKRIERDLIKKQILPITAIDIMREFEIGPGPEVGKIKRLAATLFEEKPCGANELIQRLKIAYQVK